MSFFISCNKKEISFSKNLQDSVKIDTIQTERNKELEIVKPEIAKYCDNEGVWNIVTETIGNKITLKTYPGENNSFYKNKDLPQDIFEGYIENGEIFVPTPKEWSNKNEKVTNLIFKIDNNKLYQLNNEDNYNEYEKCNSKDENKIKKIGELNNLLLKDLSNTNYIEVANKWSKLYDQLPEKFKNNVYTTSNAYNTEYGDLYGINKGFSWGLCNEYDFNELGTTITDEFGATGGKNRKTEIKGYRAGMVYFYVKYQLLKCEN